MMLKLLAQHLAHLFSTDKNADIVTSMYFDGNKSMYLIGLWR